MAKTNGDIARGYAEAKASELALIRTKGVVGIGSAGEYEAMGGFFDSIFYQYLPNSSYKDIYMGKLNARGLPRTEEDWKKKVAQMEELLLEAQDYSWIPPEAVVESQRKNMAVDAGDFAKLLQLFEEIQGITDAELSSWAKTSEAEGLKAGRHLLKVASYGGIHQLSPTGGARPVLSEMIESSKPLPKAVVEAKPMEAEAPKKVPDASKEARRALLAKAKQRAENPNVPAINDSITEGGEVPPVVSSSKVGTPVKLEDIIKDLDSEYNYDYDSGVVEDYIKDLDRRGFNVKDIKESDIMKFFDTEPD